LECEVKLELIDKSLAISTPPQHLNVSIPSTKVYKTKKQLKVAPKTLDEKLRMMRVEVNEFKKS
jgi:hypothetical protein